MAYGRRYGYRRYYRRRRPVRRVPIKRTTKFARRRLSPFRRMARKGPQQSSYKHLPRLVGPSSAVEPALGLPFRTVRLRYSEMYTLTAAGTVGNYWGFRINSLYDPDYSFGGHQPMGRDQWAALYNEYRIRRWFCNITLANQSDHVVRVVTLFSDSTTDLPFATSTSPTSAEVAALVEQRSPQFGHRISMLGATETHNYNYPSRKNESRFVDLKDMLKFHGENFDEQWISIGNNPVYPMYFFMFIMPEDMSTVGSSVRFNVTMSFDTEFKGQQVQALN